MSLRRLRLLAAVAVIAASCAFVKAQPASAGTDYYPISGAGSTWSQNALNQWIKDVSQYGMKINYAGTGSSDGRQEFINGTVDFAASDIPFQLSPDDGSAPENPVSGSYAYMPITAGGTTFMYNLSIGGHQVTNLRLSGQNITKIFTGGITMWNDPAIAADNPGLTLPDEKVVPVVRSDGSGSTAQLTEWMITQYPALWNAYCAASGRAPDCGETSYYPTITGMVAQSGDLGVAGYVAQKYAQGAIGYVNYSYALNAGFPVAQMLNAAGYYTEPTPDNVAVSLLQAQINTDPTSPNYLTEQLSGVYNDADPRTYPLSSYSYLIMPTQILPNSSFTAAKGATLAAFTYYSMCQGQQDSASLGYSPMPINLVEDSFNQIKKIPGAAVENINIQSCNNPTFTSNGTNALANTAPEPPACDKQGPSQCSAGTGGSKTATAVAPSAGKAGTGTPSSGTASSGAAAGSDNAGPTSGAQAAGPQQCGDSATCSRGGGAAITLPEQAVAAIVTLPGAGGWTSTQTWMVLAGLFMVALVLAPSLVGGLRTRRRRKR